MEEQIVYSFQKNSEEEMRFSLRTYKERFYLDIRLWFQPSSGGDLRPTKKGLTLGLEHLSEMKKGLERSIKHGAELALQEPSNSVK